MSGLTTRSKTQSARDAVLNNPDLLCHIAEQADLRPSYKLLTTSKHNHLINTLVMDAIVLEQIYRNKDIEYDDWYDSYWDWYKDWYNDSSTSVYC
jgi:hypothetical protein